ncbi:MAG: hypothetical protein QF926_07220 [Alphaproteobacteria bacterium]|nr:hypothetical protein [Alphaproteobacteria bacterium]MDP6516396.1 hypothetical protein [Alphaproteobacteria bacterium]
MSLSLNVTVIILVVAVIAFGIANRLSRTPVERRRISGLPYGMIQFVALVAAVLMIAHLVTLLTGQPLKGRLDR